MRTTILERLKSPVVIGAIIVALFNLITAVTGIEFEGVADSITLIVTNLGLIFAAINDATSKTNF